MKKSIFSIILFGILALVSCKKDEDSGGGNSFTAKVNGENYEAKGLLAYATSFGDYTNVYGVADATGTGETMYFAIPNGATKGTYQFDADFPAYYVDADGNAFATAWGGGSGSVTITEFDADHVEGTFQFNAFDAVTEAEEKAVTDGKFNVEFR
jgi:Family of unknown function (DUF6252)